MRALGEHTVHAPHRQTQLVILITASAQTQNDSLLSIL